MVKKYFHSRRKIWKLHDNFEKSISQYNDETYFSFHFIPHDGQHDICSF